MIQSSPGLLSHDSSGSGPGVILDPVGNLNSAANPAPRGSSVVIYATGEGQTSPAGVNEKLADAPYPKPLLSVSVSIDGIDAEIAYAGSAPGLVSGLLQINVTIPSRRALGSGPRVVEDRIVSEPDRRHRRGAVKYAGVRTMKRLALFAIVFALLLQGGGYKIVHTYPHDPQAYTQGLIYYEGFLYEGTGLNDRSSLRKGNWRRGECCRRSTCPAIISAEDVVEGQADSTDLAIENRLCLRSGYVEADSARLRTGVRDGVSRMTASG